MKAASPTLTPTPKCALSCAVVPEISWLSPSTDPQNHTSSLQTQEPPVSHADKTHPLVALNSLRTV